jgi:hypothetical protein
MELCCRLIAGLLRLSVGTYLLRHSHGGTGCGSAHKPFRASRASVSSLSSTIFPGAYFRYHQHQPRTSKGLRIHLEEVAQVVDGLGNPLLALGESRRG